MPKKKAGGKVSPFQRSLIQTEALRSYVPREQRQVFDHVLADAKDHNRLGHTKKALEGLAQARKLLPKPSADAQRLVLRLKKRARGNQADVLVNGQSFGSGAYDMGGGDIVRAFRGVVAELREKYPGAHIVLPGGIVNENELITGEDLQRLLD